MTDRREAFERDGFVACPAFQHAMDHARLLNQLARFVEHVIPDLPGSQVYYETPGDPSSLKQVQQLGQYDPWFDALHRDSPFTRLAEELLDDEVVPHNIQYFDKPPGDSRPTPPHQDGAYFPIRPNHAVTMWLALTEVSEEQGCVRYVRGSNHRGLREHAPTETLGFSRGIVDYGTAEDRQNEVAMVCQSGDLLAHHSMTIHRADANRHQERNRPALGFIYFAKSSSFDAAADAEYQARLAKRLEGEGKLG